LEKITIVNDRPNDPQHRSFEEIIRCIGGGSEAAVWELLDRYSKNILRVVRRHLPAEIRNKVDSVDIVQSVWKSFLLKDRDLEQAISAERFVAYLAGMARLKVLETHRHFTRREAFDIRREVPLVRQLGGDPNKEDCFIDRRCDAPSAVVRAQDNWERAMEKAGDRGQQVVQLKLQGLTLDEIAEQLQLSKSTVRRILDSMLQSLTA
jgi:RNA polymerase sigma factor (sigma-70 family)